MSIKKNEWIPYVYRIDSIDGKYMYVGSETKLKANPVNLWKSYFTSSKTIKELIKKNGEEYFSTRILKEFRHQELLKNFIGTESERAKALISQVLDFEYITISEAKKAYGDKCVNINTERGVPSWVEGNRNYHERKKASSKERLGPLYDLFQGSGHHYRDERSDINKLLCIEFGEVAVKLVEKINDIILSSTKLFYSEEVGVSSRTSSIKETKSAYCDIKFQVNDNNMFMYLDTPKYHQTYLDGQAYNYNFDINSLLSHEEDSILEAERDKYIREWVKVEMTFVYPLPVNVMPLEIIEYLLREIKTICIEDFFCLVSSIEPRIKPVKSQPPTYSTERVKDGYFYFYLWSFFVSKNNG